MLGSETRSTGQASTTVRSDCPQCGGRLSILRVIAGKSESEYWTMRCTKCGGIHLDIIKAPSPSQAS